MRWWRCKGVEVGFVEAVGYRGERGHLSNRSDLEGVAETRDCSKVVEKRHVESDRHGHWSARRWGWSSKVVHQWCY